MIKIRINNPEAALAIGAWCNKQFGEKKWTLDAIGLFTDNTKYIFGLHNKKDAVLFSLKWAEFV